MAFIESNDNWEEKYRIWKAKKSKKLEKITNKPLDFIITEEKKIEKVAVKEVKRVENINEESVRNLRKNINLNKKTVISISVLLIIIILGIMFYSTYNPINVKYKPIDIEIRNTSGLPSNVFYEGKALFSLSGWESFLNYGKNDRFFGNEQYKKIIFDSGGRAYTQIALDDQIRLEPLASDPNKVTLIGWFVESDSKKIMGAINKGSKEVSLLLNNTKLSAGFSYLLFKNKQYFIFNFSPQVVNLSSLGDFALGFIANKFDIYLPNGTILKNDNNVTKTDRNINVVIVGNASNASKDSLKQKVPSDVLSRNIIIRKGSYSKFDALDYEIFLNNNSQGFIVFSEEEENKFENLFQWNIFRIYISHQQNGIYTKAYFIILDNANLHYDYENKDWVIEDKYYSGSARNYINSIKAEALE